MFAGQNCGEGYLLTKEGSKVSWTVFAPENSLSRVHWINLVGVEEYRLPITGIDVALPTPHDYSGTFQGGYSARFAASRRVLKEARRALYPSETAMRDHCSWGRSCELCNY